MFDFTTIPNAGDLPNYSFCIDSNTILLSLLRFPQDGLNSGWKAECNSSTSSSLVKIQTGYCTSKFYLDFQSNKMYFSFPGISMNLPKTTTGGHLLGDSMLAAASEQLRGRAATQLADSSQLPFGDQSFDRGFVKNRVGWQDQKVKEKTLNNFLKQFWIFLLGCDLFTKAS